MAAAATPRAAGTPFIMAPEVEEVAGALADLLAEWLAEAEPEAAAEPLALALPDGEVAVLAGALPDAAPLPLAVGGVRVTP